MTLEDIYKWAMTPLPPPPDISPEVQNILDWLKKQDFKLPEIPPLPTKPDWMPDRPVKPGDGPPESLKP